eukprot:799125_1
MFFHPSTPIINKRKSFKRRIIVKFKHKKRNTNKNNALFEFVSKTNSNSSINYYFKENIEHTISNNDKINWDNTNEIWEFYWLSDGQCNIHRSFSCLQMFERYQYYFKNASEPVMFKRIDQNEWYCTWSDNLVTELKKYNNNINNNNY